MWYSIKYIYSGCSCLTSVVIPNSVTTIGDDAFYGCSSLKYVVISNSITDIGQDAFYGCWSLEEVISFNTTPPSIANSGTFEDVPTSDCILKVPAKSVDAYKAAEGWKEFKNIIGLSDQELEAITGIETVAAYRKSGKAFDLQGRQVGEGYKGIVIKGERKYINAQGR